MKHVVHLVIILAIGSNWAYSQCSVSNGTDYTLTGYFSPTGVITCEGGNLKFEVSYHITVSGSNIPSQPAYYYQANLICGSTTFSSPNLTLVSNTSTSVNGTYTTTGNYIAGSSCATTGTVGSDTPSSLGCINSNSINWVGNGPNSLNINTNCPSVDIALPVTLQTFEGVHKNGINKLNWSIANEVDFSHFLLERSYNAVGFEGISAPIFNATNNLFQFNDSQVKIENAKTYYRLKMVDYSGLYTYSQIIAVENFDPETVWSLSPNPSSEKQSIKWDKSTFQAKSIHVYDVKGIQIFTENLVSDTEFFQLNLPVKNTSSYIVVISDRYNRQLSKRIILN